MENKFAFLKVALSSAARLSEEEEIELLRKFQSGDTIAYRQLRTSLRPLIEKAISDAIPYQSDVSAGNLRMRAHIELPNILKSFDPNRGVKLKTYIISQLKGYMKNAVAENVSGPYVPRNQHTDLNRYRQAIRDAEMEFGHNPSEDQVRGFYPENDVKTPFDKIKQYHVKSYMSDAVFGEDEDGEGLTFKDQFTAGNNISDDDLMAGVFEDEQDQMVNQNFSPQQQDIIRRVNKEGQSFVEVALSLGVSTADVRKTVRKWYEMTQNR